MKESLNWTQWSALVHWPSVGLACLGSLVLHVAGGKCVILAAELLTSLQVPPKTQGIGILVFLLGLLVFGSVYLGRWFAKRVEDEQRRQSTVMAYAAATIVVYFSKLSSSPLLALWVIFNVMITGIAAGLSHRLGWKNLPGAVTKLLSGADVK